MRRISIDTLGLTSPRNGSTLQMATRRKVWFASSPRLLATFLLFVGLWLWSKLSTNGVMIPGDSFAYIKDESLANILNTTLGVCLEH